jgi:3-oxoacyl-[acyl-carrier protein] reductase
MDLAGRVALVTGASIGLGRRFALDLAASGATVIGIARTQSLLDALAAELGDNGWTRALDVADEHAVRTLVDEIIARHGRLDILINNAAIEERRDAIELDLESVRRTMRVNFEGTVASTLAAIPHMVARGEGWIVNMISGAGRTPIPHEAAYVASKAAVTGFSESISYELAPKGVRVKILSPGFVGSTRMAKRSVETGLPVPPKFVRRTEEQVSRALLRGLDTPGFEINCARAETIAVVTRALLPRIYRRSIVKSQL